MADDGLVLDVIVAITVVPHTYTTPALDNTFGFRVRRTTAFPSLNPGIAVFDTVARVH